MTRKENIIRTILRNQPRWLVYRYDGSLTMLEPITKARVREGGVDDWGVNWIASHSDEDSYVEEHAVISIDQARTFQVPQTSWQEVTDDLKRKVQQIQHKDTLVIVRSEAILFERMKFIMGTTEFLMATISHPQEMHFMLDQIADYQQKLTRAIMESGVVGIRFTDDWGTQNAMFIRPDDWRKFIKHRLKSIYDVVKEYRGYVFQHSCGHIEDIVPDLIEIGVDVLDPCQPKCNDIFAWKRNYGDRLSFMGGLDTQGYLTFGTPQEVREEVCKVIDIMSNGGGYIAAPSHTITIPEENRQAMLAVIREKNVCSL